MQEGADAGGAHLLADEVVRLDDGEVGLGHGTERLLVLVGEAGAGDGDVIEAAVDRLQQHRHGRAAEGDGVRLHGRRQL